LANPDRQGGGDITNHNVKLATALVVQNGPPTGVA